MGKPNRFITMTNSAQNDELVELGVLLADMAAMLRELQWDEGTLKCPVCWFEEGSGHAPDCRLAALLRRLEG